MLELLLAGLGVVLVHAWLYVVATHGPRLFHHSVRWFDGVPGRAQRLWQAALSSGLTFVSCFLLGLLISLATPNVRATLRVVVLPDSPAEAAGLETGDVVTRVNAESVDSFDQFAERVRASEGSLLLQIERGDQSLEITAVPEGGRLGVQSTMAHESRSLGQAVELCSGAFARAASALVQVPAPGVQLTGPIGLVRGVVGAEQRGYRWMVVLLLLASNWILVPVLHALDWTTLELYRSFRNRARSRDVFNIGSLGALFLLAVGASFLLDSGGSAAAFGRTADFLTRACSAALSLACFTALKRHLPVVRAGALSIVGALVGPILWIGTVVWIRSKDRAA